jgi:hypothetical protein
VGQEIVDDGQDEEVRQERRSVGEVDAAGGGTRRPRRRRGSGRGRASAICSTPVARGSATSTTCRSIATGSGTTAAGACCRCARGTAPGPTPMRPDAAPDPASGKSTASGRYVKLHIAASRRSRSRVRRDRCHAARGRSRRRRQRRVPERDQPGNVVAGSEWVSLRGAEHLHGLDPHDNSENGQAERAARASLIQLCAEILAEAGVEVGDAWAVDAAVALLDARSERERRCAVQGLVITPGRARLARASFCARYSALRQSGSGNPQSEVVRCWCRT